jgi:Fe-S cluster biogenesis protein NfuA
MREKIQAVIDKIRPMLQADGGDVEFVDVVDGVVTVRLQGACAGCPMSQMTLKNGIERYLKKEIPEVKSVERADWKDCKIRLKLGVAVNFYRKNLQAIP